MITVQKWTYKMDQPNCRCAVVLQKRENKRKREKEREREGARER